MMRLLSRKRILIGLLLAAGILCVRSTRAATILSPPADFVAVSDQTTRDDLRIVNPSSLTDPYVARSREDTSQDDVQIATFLYYDLSPFEPAQVNDPAFSATFLIDYTQRLNNINPLSVLLGRNVSGEWDSAGSNYPLHDWGFDDETSTVTAENGNVLVSNVLTQAPPIVDITVDVTDIVSNWVNGVYANEGFVLYYDRNDYQGAAFDDAELILELVPEPGATVLLLLALFPLLCTRPHRTGQPGAR
jgi:hypothetical protein